MSAGSFTMYSANVGAIGTLPIKFGSDTFVMILATTGYTPAVNTDSTYANVSAYEVASGGGYTVGGNVLGSQSFTQSTNTWAFTSAAISWSNFTATFRYGVLLRRAGSSLASTDLLIAYSDLGGGSSITGGGGTLTVTPNASGIFAITHSP
jgi:hypothetical protein